MNSFDNATLSYDAVNKIWSNGRAEKDYDDDLTIGEIIFEKLQIEPERICQISYNEETMLTREQVLRNAIKVATFLRNSGIVEGDIVGLIARNTTHLAAVAFGCMFNGTPFHAVNPNLEEGTTRSLYDITRPKIIFCEAYNHLKIQKATQHLQSKLYTLSENIQGVPSILDILNTDLVENFRPTKLKNAIDQTMAILCSSGTTGTPKAVTISNSRRIFEQQGYLTSEDVQYVSSTLDWLTGLVTLITNPIYGTKRIISTEVFSAEEFLVIVKTYQVTWVLSAAPHIAMLVSCPNTSYDKLSSLKYWHFGGSGTPVTTQKAINEHLQKDGILRNTYGFTELGSFVAANLHFKDRPTSVGQLWKGTRARIVDDEGKSLGPNQKGELLCKIDQHWNGYYGMKEATAQMQDADGWLHTGDIAYFDEDQFLYIVERKKDMLKYLGIMYYPLEVEEIIAQMPEVADVCAFGVWNELEGDAAAAAVVPKAGTSLTAQQVIDYVDSHVSVQYKRLNAGAIVVPQLHKNVNGKINRKEVKAAYLRNLKLKQI